ncbi:MAG: glycosyltransferase [Nanoarchaeota archaeon]|nr:glycosyltransferase [Nanoarchaeota archaeon]
MIPKLKEYEQFVGKEEIEKIRSSAEHLIGKRVVHVNATAYGGGVAEMLNTLVFLMNDVGIDAGWRVLFGNQSFFEVTKGIHNSLQGQEWDFTDTMKNTYLEFCKRNSIINHIDEHDIVVIHDPQPLAMIREYQKKAKWVWRCHIDISNHAQNTMDFLFPFLDNYDCSVISSQLYRIKHLKKPQFIIHPSIDPLSTKNADLSDEKARQLLSEGGIDLDKPIITQISRFDPWKNPIGVIKMYEEIKKETDCQLILAGNMAADDPEGPVIYHKVRQYAEKIPGIKILTDKDDLFINALQRRSDIIFQNSVREGFALTVSEAMWKGTPVLGTHVGGIPLQIKDGKTGFLMNNKEDGIKKAVKLLKDDKLREKISKTAKEHVKKNFLITRHLQDYIDLFSKFYPPPMI